MSYLDVVDRPKGPCVLSCRTTLHRHWERVHGPIPAGPGSRGILQLNHMCDQPKCRNLGHVWLGTQSENMRDAHKKGRILRHRDHSPRAKLISHEVMLIRHMYLTTGLSQAQIGHKFGVAQITISNIITRKSWK
jgi:hypothetical protein